DQAWEANVQATRAGHFSGREGQRFKGLANLTKAMELKPGHAALDVRNEAVGCLVLPDLEVAKEVPWPYASTMATVNRGLPRYARVDTEGRVVIHRVADNQVLFELPHRALVGYHGWRFSPDGQYLWHHEVDKWRVWDVGGDRAVQVLELAADVEAGIDFTADS